MRGRVDDTLLRLGVFLRSAFRLRAVRRGHLVTAAFLLFDFYWHTIQPFFGI